MFFCCCFFLNKKATITPLSVVLNYSSDVLHSILILIIRLSCEPAKWAGTVKKQVEEGGCGSVIQPEKTSFIPAASLASH